MPKQESNVQEPSFEVALNQLEQLVDSLENGEVPLAELIEKYAEGNQLLKQCQQHLQAAELRISLLQKDGSTSLLELGDPQT